MEIKAPSDSSFKICKILRLKNLKTEQRWCVQLCVSVHLQRKHFLLLSPLIFLWCHSDNNSHTITVGTFKCTVRNF